MSLSLHEKMYVKKRYQYILLKSTIAFHELPEAMKQEQIRAERKIQRGAAGVFMGDLLLFWLQKITSKKHGVLLLRLQ